MAKANIEITTNLFWPNIIDEYIHQVKCGGCAMATTGNISKFCSTRI